MRDHPKPPPPEQQQPVRDERSFEDFTYQMISTVSPVKMAREDIPYDSVRQIVLTEIMKSKQRAANRASLNGRRRTMDELLEEAPSSSSSSSHIGESSSSNLDRGTMTDDGESSGTPRPIAARLYGDCTRSSSTSTSSAIPSGSSEATDGRKKPLNYREKRLAEIRAARMKKYRENVEIVEFKCEEIGLKDEFGKFFQELLDDDALPATIYYRVVESLDFYFRAKTWESNCPKLLCEFLTENILKSCQELNEEHESSNAPDDWKSREIQIQVLLTLHVFVVTDEKEWLDEAINKMRMIFISVGAEKLRTFVEEPVTDIFLELIGDGLATIYDDLCINLPADLIQYNAGLFRMTETDDSVVVKRRNGVANRLEQMLIETSDSLGVGGVERATRNGGAGPSTSEGPIRRRNSKRKNEELLSPARPSRTAAASRSDYKKFFVEETPDEKYYKKNGRKPREVEDVEEEDEEEEEDDDEDEDEDVEESEVVTKKKKRTTIKEEIDEEVKQTPVAKLRAGAASKSGKRCSRRLSELVKLSEERSKVPKKARENLNRILEKAKTPIRSVPRPARKSVLFGSTPSSSPAIVSNGSNKKTSSRASLMSRFAAASPDEVLSVDTSGGHEEDSPQSSAAASEVTSPTLRERSNRKKPVRFRSESTSRSKANRVVKQEVEDDDEEEETPTTSPSKRASSSKNAAGPSTSSSSAAHTPSATKWTDRKLKRELGLTREDLNRYRNAMLMTGQGNRDRNVNINWENAQVNRAGRVKGAGNSEDGTPIFGIARRNVRTMICHVLLNDTNPDTSFNWNKVKFDDLDDKPRTRQFQSLKQRPEAYMESLKQKYMEKKALPLKRMRSNAAAAAAAAAANATAMSSADLISLKPSTSTPTKKKSRKRVLTLSSSPPKKRISSIVPPLTDAQRERANSEDYDHWGFESEADD